jgi:maltooligosyltrehalose synthase
LRQGFFKFHDILENGENSPYLDWFYIRSLPLNAYSPDKSLGYQLGGTWLNCPKSIPRPPLSENFFGMLPLTGSNSASMVAFARQWQSECLITVLNVSRKACDLDKGTAGTKQRPP